jgi:hypothetical protein
VSCIIVIRFSRYSLCMDPQQTPLPTIPLLLHDVAICTGCIGNTIPSCAPIGYVVWHIPLLRQCLLCLGFQWICHNIVTWWLKAGIVEQVEAVCQASECPFEWRPVEGVWQVVAKSLFSLKSRPHFKTHKIREKVNMVMGPDGGASWLPELWDSEIWSSVPWDSESRMTVMTGTSSNLLDRPTFRPVSEVLVSNGSLWLAMRNLHC